MAEPVADQSIPPGEPTSPGERFRESALPSGGSGFLIGPGPLGAWGFFLAVGFACLGLIAGAVVLLESHGAGESPAAANVIRWLRAAWVVFAFILAGSAAFYFHRLAATLLAEVLERDRRRTRQIDRALEQLATLSESIAAVLDERGRSSRADHDQTRADALENRIAQLKAAREVNDPARVLELYEGIAGSLEPEVKRTLESEVAQWFLTSIYRRLRTGKIQIEVVELATRFATSFATTTEGASVQAALPTLRRSAGLCPQCAQPYTGFAKACPECLGLGSELAGAPAPDPEPISPDLGD